MRTYASLAVSLLLLWAGQVTGVCGNNSDLFFIRRAFICELGIPPSISEIEWFMTYQTNTLVSGIEHVLNIKYGKETSIDKIILFNFYTDPNNKTIVLTLTQEQRDLILRYQTGNLNSTVENAKKTLLECALASVENSEDPIDYLFVSLCGRYSNTQEYDVYNKIFKNGKGSDFDNLLLVLNTMLQSKCFINY
jgi:hypothetical protein